MTKHIYTGEQLDKMDAFPWFTPREREVFDRKYKHDQSIVAIADQMFISTRTVDTVIQSIKKKTGMLPPS